MMGYKFCYEYDPYSEKKSIYFGDLSDEFFDELRSIITKKQLEVHKLKNTPIEILKDELSAKTYEKLTIVNKLTNMFDLSELIFRRYNGMVHTRLIQVANVRGDEVCKAMEKLNFSTRRDYRKG